ncbi:hypothetical protein HOV04_gp29 [Xanthomonas phage XcP1]|uniref:Uncharacterized protein n=1 Tax=Xanthomonas phage XcP1 TaxID=2785027 RepID=A0A3S7L8G5_9CAUD|nr:hypothetical protein HOV04_gp29 [Xanthomonas phage XcP1]AWN08531.1 hypothetical protein XcP1_029 [Xanthomonas phage XcP1]
MTLTKYNTDIRQSIKWQQNKAPNIQSIINQKYNWYSQFNEMFWKNWQRDVFTLKTASPFGLLVWCIILGVPSQLFGLYGNTASWAFGPNRQNFKYSGSLPAPPGANLVGGNFAGGGDTTILSIREARLALLLRYAALVSNGRISYVNRMLNWIFNDGNEWDIESGRYFYVADSTVHQEENGISVSPIIGAFNIEYRIGPGMDFSSQFINLLNEPDYGITPQFSGSKYVVIKES